MPRKNFPRSLLKPDRYKGGCTHTFRNNTGYILEYHPLHPACSRKGMVLQHRLVMECHLGRFLTGQEVVHHLNGERDDNRIENLELLASQSVHGLLHQLPTAPMHNAEIVERVRVMAEDPTIKGPQIAEALGVALQTVHNICRRYRIKYVYNSFAHLTEEEIRATLLRHPRKVAYKKLGISVQSLWNRYPELMRSLPNQRKLKSYGQRDVVVRKLGRRGRALGPLRKASDSEGE